MLFNTLRPIWRATSLSLQNKIRIFGTNVKSVLLYVKASGLSMSQITVV